MMRVVKGGRLQSSSERNKRIVFSVFNPSIKKGNLFLSDRLAFLSKSFSSVNEQHLIFY